ncbi:MAG: DUF222 domain-containing protein, partial [Pseudonocardiaceae bacterium]
AKAPADQAELLTPRRSLTGEVLLPALPATAAELAAGAIGPTHLRVITATLRRIPSRSIRRWPHRPSRPWPPRHAGSTPPRWPASATDC